MVCIYVMFSLVICTGPCEGYSSQIYWKMQGKSHLNSRKYGLASLNIVPLTQGVTAYGFFNRFRMSHGLWFSWGLATMWDISRDFPKACTESSDGIIMMNPYHTHSDTLPWTNSVVYDFHADVCSPQSVSESITRWGGLWNSMDWYVFIHIWVNKFHGQLINCCWGIFQGLSLIGFN